MSRTPKDMDGKPYTVGQTVLFASAYGSTARIERREVSEINSQGSVRVKKPGVAQARGGWLGHPERHLIEKQP